MSQAAPQSKYFTKVVQFNGQKMTLFSLDGNTWSSRKLELDEIKQRHEQQRLELAGKEEEVEAGLGAGAPKFARDEESEEVADDYDSQEKSKSKKDDSEPFSISDIDEEYQESEKDTQIVSRGKSVKAIKKLPAKPESLKFNKNNKKTSVKTEVKKKLDSKEKANKANLKKQKVASKQIGKKKAVAAKKKRQLKLKN